MKKIVVCILLLAMALTLCACGKKAAPVPTEAPTPEPTQDPAAEVDAAAALFDEGKYPEAIRALSALQTVGSPTVSSLLGKAYYQGLGADTDYNRAIGYLQDAVAGGVVSARYLLADASYNGNGLRKDLDEASRGYIKFVAQADEVDPADRDYAASMTYLADCFAKGRGVEKNFDLALAAADKAYAAADKLTPYELMNLAAFYDSARPNAVSAEFDAATDGPAAAESEPAAATDDPAATDGTPAVSPAVENARKVDAAKAADLYTRAADGIKSLADAGNLHAVKYLGDLYFYGMGGYKQDYAKALETYMTAAEQGDADAQAQIGRIYMDGLGVEQNAEKAMDWNMRAAEQGNAQGQEQIGKMYYLGIGMTKSTEEASRWFERARDAGSQWAAAMLEQPDVSVAADYHSAHA